MKTVNLIVKILAALAAITGIVYVIATYGDQIVAWAKKLLASCPCKCDAEDCADCQCEAECPCEEVAVEEPAVEEVATEEAAPAEEPAAEEAVDEAEAVAEEADFEG